MHLPVRVSREYPAFLNLQPRDSIDQQDDGSLDVVEIFPTIQGEGPFAGQPAIFVRLAGCNLQCPACDTDYTSNRRRLSAHDLRTLIDENRRISLPGSDLVVVTGGEPFRQACGPFTELLLGAGYRVQFETNGSLRDESIDRGLVAAWRHKLTIVCSPKTPATNPRNSGLFSHYKYVLKAGQISEDDGLPLDVLNSGIKPARPEKGFTEFHKDQGGVSRIYVQPLDEHDPKLNYENTRACLEVVKKFGYTLSLQTHKILGLR